MKSFAAIFLVFALFLAGSASGRMMRPSLTTVLSPKNKGFDRNGKNFDILTKLLVATGLDKVLIAKRHITIFAPNDAAFVATVKELAGIKGMISEKRAFNILQDVAKKGVPVKRGRRTVVLKNKDLVSFILTYHVLPFELQAKYILRYAFFVKTLAKKSILTTASLEIVDKSKTTLNPVVISPNLKFKGGILVHVIDRVLLPF